MHLKHIISILASGAFLAACDSTVTNINDESKAEGTITIRVVDNHSGAALPSVTVYSVVDDETVVSDDLGNSTWEESALGDHAFQISKEGYATVQTTVTLAEQGQGDVPRVGDVVAVVPMYKAGVVAKGIVLYTDDKGKVGAAKGVTVYAKLPNYFVPSEISVKTSDEGEYTFESLPEGTEIAVYVGQESINSQKYIGADVRAIGGETYRAGDQINVATINLEKLSASIVKVSDNAAEMSATSDFSMTFAAELLKDSVTKDHWTVTNGSGSVVLSTVSLSSDKRTIKITPYSGKWNTETSYSVRGTVYSVEGATSTVSTSFSVGAKSSGDAPAQVKNLTVEQDEDYTYIANLSWTAPKGDIGGYNIYYMTDENPDFVKYTSVSSTSTSYSFDVDDYLPNSVKQVSFIVLPYNEDGVEANIEEAQSVTYKIPATTTVDDE